MNTRLLVRQLAGRYGMSPRDMETAYARACGRNDVGGPAAEPGTACFEQALDWHCHLIWKGRRETHEARFGELKRAAAAGDCGFVAANAPGGALGRLHREVEATCALAR